ASGGRVGADQVSTWQAAREVRPIPRELKGLPEVRLARWALLGAVVAFVVTLPLWLDESRINLAAIIVIFGIVGVSLVVLTGWAGQVSLGQMGFAGVGAAVGGWVTYYTVSELSLALLAGGAADHFAAIGVGYPSFVRGVRRSRTGRVLIAIRENDSAARSYGINTTRTNLACFALSGFIAAVAGVLLVHQQTGLQVGAGNLYLPDESLRVFSMVVIGG